MLLTSHHLSKFLKCSFSCQTSFRGVVGRLLCLDLYARIWFVIPYSADWLFCGVLRKKQEPKVNQDLQQIVLPWVKVLESFTSPSFILRIEWRMKLLWKNLEESIECNWIKYCSVLSLGFFLLTSNVQLAKSNWVLIRNTYDLIWVCKSCFISCHLLWVFPVFFQGIWNWSGKN